MSQKHLPKRHQNFLQNGGEHFFFFFDKKAQILFISYCTILFKFHQHVVQISINDYCKEALDFQCQRQQW